MSALSGGWRRRVMLGRALDRVAGLLLLDEPTNHLDIDAITWLEDMMQDFDGALLFVSHDRAFVRRLATRIVELDRGQLRVWPGGYDDYVTAKARGPRGGSQTCGAVRQEAGAGGGMDPPRGGGAAHPQRGQGARAEAAASASAPRAARAHRQVEHRAQDAAPSGKLVFEAQHVTLSFGRAR
jgi:ATP-binding cassette subfamily F protein uup